VGKAVGVSVGLEVDVGDEEEESSAGGLGAIVGEFWMSDFS
jgi:hypothetical protein